MSSGICPLDTYVKIGFDSEITREYMSVYQQKIADSDEFICVFHEEGPVGQHMIDFLVESNALLPPLVSKMKNIFRLTQDKNFDHHLMPVYLENIFELYKEVKSIHFWWDSCLPLNKLWHDFNNYAFYSIHPSPYLLDTYNEVNRLMDEEYYWGVVCDQLQAGIKWLEIYVTKLSTFYDALVCCLDDNQQESLTLLSGIQRAFLFRSFFDDQFLNRTPINIHYDLHEVITSPLGKTVSRDQIKRPETTGFLTLNNSNMNFKSVAAGDRSSIQLHNLAKMISEKKIEVTQEVILQEPMDISSICSLTLYLLITRNMHVKKCKNCGKYFVPLNRRDEQYCCRVQANGKMCRELDYEKKINADSLLTIYRTAYKTHNARKCRNLKNHPKAEQEFKEWVTFAKQLFERAKAGEISGEEFQRLIKE